jgi:sporulation protein YlmC with PRC-barrel domain
MKEDKLRQMKEEFKRMRVSEFQRMTVETESGRFLGHVFDLRSEGEAEYGAPHDERSVTKIVYGRMGLLARLGLDEVDATTLPWNAVKAIRGDKIIVEDSAAERA